MIPRLVIFDVDGTLIDSLDGIVTIMGLAFVEHGFDEPPADAVRGIVGRSLDLAIAELLGPDREGDARRVADTYREVFRTETARRPPPLFPGALEAIAGLGAREDTLLGIATGKSRRGLMQLLAANAGLDSAFHTIRTADESRSKPDPDMVLSAMAETGAEPAATVMVGDSTLDMAMARAAGVSAIGVTWGSHGRDELVGAGAHATVERFGELVDAIDCALAGPRAAGV